MKECVHERYCDTGRDTRAVFRLHRRQTAERDSELLRRELLFAEKAARTRAG